MNRSIKMACATLVLSIISISCEKDNPDEIVTQDFSDGVNLEAATNNLELKDDAKKWQDENSKNLAYLFRNAVAPSPCGPTELRDVQNKYINSIIADPLALSYVSLYSDINYYYSFLLNEGDQYFGEDGNYTQLMTKRERELNKFWSMPVDITVKGEHTANLNDREKVAEVFYSFFGFRDAQGNFVPLTQEQAYEQADIILELNEQSPNLPENPYFATDGFASSNRTIVIGDGLPDWLSQTGIDEGIVWTGILAHEWAHEIQFLNFGDWYPNGAAQDPAEATRYTELEADFIASYYMTHKRGATYNWKRVEQFLDLYFQIGDCSFSSSGHHGTPAQRMAASRAGYDLAQNAQKQGHILTMDEAHAAFVATISDIL
ncbi:hypothetical protein [Flavimarina sp. Hel_I_48]|uniref:hypothetical protein n=1 Tax=Flavimarina sp. Hel_I_48 TaxID=1392488 RepID=UPI0004DF65A6|nr:hypothetical protein [Flavimarina sp. Hel_I_48]